MGEKNPSDRHRDRGGIVAFTDLVFGARIRAAADVLGVQATATTAPDRIVAAVERGAAAVFVDLDSRAADPVALITHLKNGKATRKATVVAFASHVRTDILQAARDAGADRVFARGGFARQLPDLVREFAGDT